MDSKTVITWGQISWLCDEWISCRRGRCFTVCFQVCWVSIFLVICNSRYAAEKSLSDAKPIAWTKFALNLVLLRNLQQLCFKLWAGDVCHHVFTFLNPQLKPRVRATTWKKKATSTRINSGYLRWFPQDIWAIMAKITLPKKHHGMVIFWIQLRRTYRDLSSQADPRGKIELKLSIFQLKQTFRVS